MVTFCREFLLQRDHWSKGRQLGRTTTRTNKVHDTPEGDGVADRTIVCRITASLPAKQTYMDEDAHFRRRNIPTETQTRWVEETARPGEFPGTFTVGIFLGHLQWELIP